MAPGTELSRRCNGSWGIVVLSRKDLDKKAEVGVCRASYLWFGVQTMDLVIFVLSLTFETPSPPPKKL